VVTRWIHTSLLGAIATKRACLRFSRACFNPRCLLPLVASTLPADPPLLGPASLLLPTGHRSEHPRECTWLLASWQKIDFCTRIECCRMQEIPLTMITTVLYYTNHAVDIAIKVAQNCNPCIVKKMHFSHVFHIRWQIKVAILLKRSLILCFM
jgi:hypothetical protein